MEQQEPDKRLVTWGELRGELNKIPVRWEVYSLILGGAFLNRQIPNIDIGGTKQTIEAVIGFLL